MYGFNYKTVIGSRRETSKCQLNFDFNQINSWCINYNQYIKKVINKLHMNALNCESFKLEAKVTRSVIK